MTDNLSDLIIYSDSHILVANKPRGLISQEAEQDSFPALLSELLSRDEGKQVKLYTVHRLDRETEGLIAYAKTQEAAAALSRSLLLDSHEKIYTACLCGVPKEQSGSFCDLLYYDKSKNKSFIAKKERKGVKKASLSYELLSVSPDGKASAVKVKLHTGRTHQIRVQFASRGLPIQGDRRYGAPADFGSALLLCASSLSFLHPATHKPLSFNISPSWIHNE